MNLLRSATGVKSGHILGIRPEHVDVGITSGTNGWQAVVESIEMLGAERLLYCRLGGLSGEQLVVRTEESVRSPALGQTIGLVPRADRIHHFDATTGARVSA